MRAARRVVARYRVRAKDELVQHSAELKGGLAGVVKLNILIPDRRIARPRQPASGVKNFRGEVRCVATGGKATLDDATEAGETDGAPCAAVST